MCLKSLTCFFYETYMYFNYYTNVFIEMNKLWVYKCVFSMYCVVKHNIRLNKPHIVPLME